MFERIYAVNRQSILADNAEYTLTQKSPTLNVLKQAYGEENVEAWMFSHLSNLALTTGTATGIEQMATQLMWMASNIMANYPALRASELVIFFSRFKAGYYERFYGQFDPLVVTTSLNAFVDWARDVRWRATEKAARAGGQQRDS
ncbi:MAG: hypothetical protein MJZ15_03665 [Bacteroidales bacterium]|nr:hypothetical protein [Bacteroidales bacterium]